MIDKVTTIIKTFRTEDPFLIAEAAGIYLIFNNNLEKIKGMYALVENLCFILINGNLSFKNNSLYVPMN